MDEIRFVAGPIVQRHMDKIEEERLAKQKIEDEKRAKEKAEAEAKAKAEEEKKKAEQAAKGEAEKDKEPVPEVEMTDASDPGVDAGKEAEANAKGPEVTEVD